MAKKSPDKSGRELTALIAEKVFSWRNVRQSSGELRGKKQDKVGRWRQARVPPYATDPAHAYAIEERMKQLGRWERYEKELARIAKASDLPLDWATPEQKSRAAIKAVGK